MATSTNIGLWQPVPISDLGNRYQYRIMATSTNIGLWQPVPLNIGLWQPVPLNIGLWQPVPVAHRTVAILAHIPNVTSVSSSATRRLHTNGTSDYSSATRTYYCHTGLLKCIP